MAEDKFPLQGFKPTPEEYEALKEACRQPGPPPPPVKQPFPQEVNANPDEEEYKRLMAAARGELYPKHKRRPPSKRFQMSVDVDFNSPEYERLRQHRDRRSL